LTITGFANVARGDGAKMRGGDVAR
jgi:hypothetical protein